MFKRILVPVDPAKPFAGANEYACRIAKRFGSTIIANYIVDESLVAGAGEAVGALDSALEYVGKDAIDDFARNHPDIPVEKRLSYGHTATVIFQTVLGTGADLVVVGGFHTGTNPHVWGSTVSEIVAHDERPTFVVRRDHALPGPGEHIIVPFDGSDRPTENLGRICNLAKELGCGIDLVFVAKRKNAEAAMHILEKGRIIVEGSGVDAVTHCIEGGLLTNKGKLILKHAKAVDSPLIALSRLGRTSGQTGYSRTLTYLLTHSEMPVWVVRK